MKSIALALSKHQHCVLKPFIHSIFVLFLHSMELLLPSTLHLQDSTHHTGRVLLKTEETPDLLGSGTGLDPLFSYQSNKRPRPLYVSAYSFLLSIYFMCMFYCMLDIFFSPNVNIWNIDRLVKINEWMKGMTCSLLTNVISFVNC